jgi:hypothetical protein
MRLFFSQYRISSALDQALRSSVPQPEPPSDLHASIMRSVRGAGRLALPAPKASIVRWLPAPAFAALVCALWAWHVVSVQAPARSALARASTALAASGEIARMVPTTALAPLTEEWQRLNQDLNNTAEFLLAALP